MNFLNAISGKSELWNIPSKSLIQFEQMQQYIKFQDYVVINTLKEDMQHCLIENTILAKNEVSAVEKALKESKPFVIYGMHYYDASLLRKYQQLKNLGVEFIYVYGGGMFEWLLLQDIYGKDQFPTNGRELDILKYRPTIQ